MASTPDNASAGTPKADLTVNLESVTDWEAIPEFDSFSEEANYWERHQITPQLMQANLVGADNTESTTITLRIDPRMLSRLKRLARQRYLNYQSMLKQWLAERLENELR